MESDLRVARLKRKEKFDIMSLTKLVDLTHVNIVKFSPCTLLVALVSNSSVKILQLKYCSKKSEELLSYCSDFIIEDIKWSPDSQSLLLMSLEDCQFVSIRAHSEDIFRFQNPRSVKLMSVHWAPDCQHLISISAHNIYTFVHSLIDGRKLVIPSISFFGSSHQPLLSFSYSGQYLALVHHVNCAFHIILMSTSLWTVLWNKETDLFVVEGIKWSADSALLAVWDSTKKILFLNINGEPARTLQYHDSSVTNFTATSFSPGNDLFVASLSGDQEIKIIVYNLLTWNLSAILNTEVRDDDVGAWSGCPMYSTAIHDSGSILGNTSMAVESQLLFSQCGNFLASSLKRGFVSIWSMGDGCRLFYLFRFHNYFAGLQWHPTKTILAFSVANNIVVWKSPKNGPNPKEATFSSFNTSIPYPCTVLWSKKNLILLPPEKLEAVILISTSKN